MRLSFWGVRGTVPAPKHVTWRYGGNTSCLELRAADQVFILDAGTGIQDLGRQLSHEFAPRGLTLHLLFSHYHWDHLQGLPFFGPLYGANNTLRIFGPRPQHGSISLRGVLHEIFRPPFFPIPLDQVNAKQHVQELAWESNFAVGNIRIHTCRLNHPQGALAYRFDCGGSSFVYATDHEPGDPVCDNALRQLARGADVLVSDAQYPPEELRGPKAGWGHGSWEHSVALARDARVKNLVLFHHDPIRTDQQIDGFLFQARRLFANTWAAGEGMHLEMAASGVRVRWRDAHRLQPASFHAPVREPAVQDNPRLPGVSAAPLPTNVLVSQAADSRRNGAGTSKQRRDQRRYDRLPLRGASADAELRAGIGGKAVRVLDLSFGGVSLLVDDVSAVPEVFHVRLKVPLLPVAEFRVRRVYAQRLAEGKYRVGCRFSS